jgi:hypothetical protein
MVVLTRGAGYDWTRRSHLPGKGFWSRQLALVLPDRSRTVGLKKRRGGVVSQRRPLCASRGRITLLAPPPPGARAPRVLGQGAVAPTPPRRCPWPPLLRLLRRKGGQGPGSASRQLAPASRSVFSQPPLSSSPEITGRELHGRNYQSRADVSTTSTRQQGFPPPLQGKGAGVPGSPSAEEALARGHNLTRSLPYDLGTSLCHDLLRLTPLHLLTSLAHNVPS